PAAVIQNGTLQGQRSVLADIGRLPDLVHRAGLDSPAIIVIGEVVKLAQSAVSEALLAEEKSFANSRSGGEPPRGTRSKSNY
ncbi:MAG: hypothetical protein ACREV2_12880, partial [Burkholderiales bacterium]